MPHDYPPPLDRLLSLGMPRADGRWTGYVSRLGLSRAHVPGLVRMATDPALAQADSGSDEVWGPVHAWRALGQLRATEAIDPLLALLRTAADDWTATDLPAVFERIGPAALPGLAALFTDDGAGDEARTTAASALARLAAAYPVTRDPVVHLLCAALDASPPDSEVLNGHLVTLLLELRAAEAAPALERAYAAERVDLAPAGDWDDVRARLEMADGGPADPPPAKEPRRRNRGG